jgi:hypothetical protein
VRSGYEETDKALLTEVLSATENARPLEVLTSIKGNDRNAGDL